MKVVVQSVLSASCVVENRIVSEIGKGYMLLVGFEKEDTIKDLELVVSKISKLRFFTDEKDKINLNIHDVKGQILSISQFTLAGKVAGGNRPDFNDALAYGKAKEYYQDFNRMLKDENIPVFEGIFGEDMKIQLINDGPLTLIIDSKELK